MDKRKDEIKSFRINNENSFIDIDFVEKLAVKITDDLVEWSNRNFFNPLGGKLSFKIPTFGEPNARTITYWSQPYSPTIEIRLSMFQEIYRDAYTFPLISKRIANETDTLRQFHSSFSSTYDNRYMYSQGIPELPTESTLGNLNEYLLAYLNAFKKNPHEKVTINDIATRFVMFELVVTWTFFHELGHLVQRHYMLKENAGGSVESEILEINDILGDKKPDISNQAREILADIEGLDLTLKYMKRKGILQSQSVYLLLCGVNCMYQRFYQGYEETLQLANGSHPHPIIRDDFFNTYLAHWIIDYLVEDKLLAAKPLAYISVRSSVMSGLFWANRYDTFDGAELPSYMTLSSGAYHQQKEEYVQTIRSEIHEALKKIKNIRIPPSNSVLLLEKCLTSASN